VREAELAEREERVHFGDAELDVLAVWRHSPLERRFVQLVERELRLVAPNADLVDPAAEVRRDADVGRDRDDALARTAGSSGMRRTP
jgi:hypothetical protein